MLELARTLPMAQKAAMREERGPRPGPMMQQTLLTTMGLLTVLLRQMEAAHGGQHPLRRRSRRPQSFLLQV